MTWAIDHTNVPGLKCEKISIEKLLLLPLVFTVVAVIVVVVLRRILLVLFVFNKTQSLNNSWTTYNYLQLNLWLSRPHGTI